MQLHTLTIVGVGLIGGSIGLAAKRLRLARHIIGVGRAVERLGQAIALGAIDEASSDLGASASQSDLLIFCTPVDRIAAQIVQVSRCCKPGAVITDAGSTKEMIVRDVESGIAPGVHFIGGHPLAGSEKKGVENARADLFDDRLTVLTPTDHTSPGAMETVRAFWRAVGARVQEMSPIEHDRALAITSHLPHLIASGLAGVLDPRWRDLAATGFRDTTRIAAGDPEVWTPIFEQNRAALLAALTLFEERLQLFREALTNEDFARIDSLLNNGKKVRDALGS